MYKSPLHFFLETVIPDYRAYEAERATKTAGLNNDLRLAMHAANSLFHLADHVFTHFDGKPEFARISKLGDYHQFLIGKCPDFALIKDCANAHKHQELTRGTPAFTKANAMREVNVNTEYKDDKGTYRVATKEIHVVLSDGTTRIFDEILLNVVNLWYEELHRLGLRSEKHKIEQPAFEIPKREVGSEAAPFNLTMMAGIDTDINFQVKQFNYDTGKSEPIDITGHEYQMTIREPPIHELSMVATETATGRQITRTLILTENEYQELLRMPTDQEKQRYLMEIPRVKTANVEWMSEVKQAAAPA